MKFTKLFTLARAGMLALSFFILTLATSVYAQTNTNTTNANTTRTVVRDDDGTDWGWLGLAGLAGLLGLMPKKRDVVVRDHDVRDPDVNRSR